MVVTYPLITADARSAWRGESRFADGDGAAGDEAALRRALAPRGQVDLGER